MSAKPVLRAASLKRLRVYLSREGSEVRVRPLDDFGDWETYRKAIEGARYIPSRRMDLASMHQVGTIIRRLTEAGFAVHKSSELAKPLLTKGASDWIELQTVKRRVRKYETDLKERSGGGLLEWQPEAIYWLARRHTGLLADEQGLGKTVSAIVAIPGGAPVLLVVPNSLKGNWIGEFERFRPSIRPKPLKGKGLAATPTDKGFRWPDDNECLIINYDILPDIHDRKGHPGDRHTKPRRACDGLLPPKKCKGCLDTFVMTKAGPRVFTNGHEEKCNKAKNFVTNKKGKVLRLPCPGCHPFLSLVRPGTVVIFDEGHLAKGRKSARGLASRAIARAVRKREGRSWVLTGTPLENNGGELWEVLDLAGVGQECFGSKSAFVTAFKTRISKHGAYEWGTPDGTEVAEMLQRGILRRMKKDVWKNAPAKLYRTLIVDLEDKILRKCDDFIQAVGGIDRFSDRLTELVEAESIGFDKMSRMLTTLAAAKIKAVLEYVEEEFENKGLPLIVFSMHAAPINAFRGRKGWVVIDGEVATSDRTELVKRFQDPNGGLIGIAGTIQTLGVGHTLTRAGHVLFIDKPWKPTDLVQAEDRAHRWGQDRESVIIISAVADHPLDRRIEEVIAKKRQLISVTVDASSVLSDPLANIEKALEAEIRQYQEDIACGRAIRRMPDTPEKRRVLELLHGCIFDAREERLALDLADQAVHIGLSEPQWALAKRIADKGVVREGFVLREDDEILQSMDAAACAEQELVDKLCAESSSKYAPPKEESETKLIVNVDRESEAVLEVETGSERRGLAHTSAASTASSSENTMALPAKCERMIMLMRQMSDLEREDLFATMAVIDEQDAPERERFFAAMALLRQHDDKELDKLHDVMPKEFCMKEDGCCGIKQKGVKHVCPEPEDDDEDEDGDEDEDEDEDAEGDEDEDEEETDGEDDAEDEDADDEDEDSDDEDEEDEDSDDE